jgi:hypothetical protein
MGLYRAVMEALIRDKAREPYFGPIYTLGRQTMPTSPDETIKMFHALNVPPLIKDVSQHEVDRTTLEAKHNRSRETIRDTDFCRMLGIDEIRAIDVSNTEGADIILDLNHPIPDALEESCGLLVDGCTLDNIFEPATGLRSIARMLRRGDVAFCSTWQIAGWAIPAFLIPCSIHSGFLIISYEMTSTTARYTLRLITTESRYPPFKRFLTSTRLGIGGRVYPSDRLAACDFSDGLYRKRAALDLGSDADAARLSKRDRLGAVHRHSRGLLRATAHLPAAWPIWDNS